MKQDYELKVNKLPTLTWNFLRMNDSNVKIKALDTGKSNVTVELSDKDITHNSISIMNKLNMKSGMGEAVDKMMQSSSVSSDNFYIPREKLVQDPIRINLDYKEEKSYKNVVEVHASEGSSVTVIMNYTSEDEIEGQAAIQTRLYAEKNAKIRLVQVQLLGNKFFHLNDIAGVCEDNAYIEIQQIVLGSKDRYMGSLIDLKGKESKMRADIAYLGKDDQKLDMNYVAKHHGEKSDSKMYANGTLDDNSYKLFRGTIDFINGCSESTGDESENVLLVGEDVVNKTIPVILCDEEDVEGAHGATIGELDDELVFYLNSRGIDMDNIYKLVKKSKIDALCNMVNDEEVTNTVHKYMERTMQNEK